MNNKTIRVVAGVTALTFGYIGELYLIGLDGAVFGTYIGALVIMVTGQSIYQIGKYKGGK